MMIQWCRVAIICRTVCFFIPLHFVITLEAPLDVEQVYFQVNTGVLYFLDYVEDIYIRVLSVLVSILNPNHIVSTTSNKCRPNAMKKFCNCSL